MGRNNNWIKLNRQITDHWLWEDKPYTKGQAWVDLLIKAEWCDGTEVEKGGEKIVLKRGQIATSINELAESWGWNRSKVYRFLDRTQTEHMANIDRNTHRTLITIENYSKYQCRETVTEQEPNTDRTSTELPTIYIKNKELRNKNIGRFTPPSVEDVTAYVLEKGYNIDPEAFCDYYESVGWMVGKNKKMKDWKAAVRNWKKNDYGKPKKMTPKKMDWSNI